ncbi:alanine racemase [Aurantimonas sp. MSK8Z-1]|uniref:alanine racemase n=1 Tax=Mangrovibrevibacter kandeliae TaxID=2968473 RepID=UPI002119696A|nr:alanine racemase [Aurantimonas sp. MSK8Z-1]MCW4114144.1 alanine racemase [Aurantimonas sp. MSK8Z-1]
MSSLFVPARVRSDRQSVVTIDRGALEANWRALAALQPQARTGAAVKADGYGLGAAEVARSLAAAGCRDFFTAWASEGAAVREALASAHEGSHARSGIRIFVLQGLDAPAVPTLLEFGLTPVLSTPEDVAVWREGLREAGTRAPAALQVESGMNRLGLDRRDAEAAAELVTDGSLELSLVMSHLASADELTSQSEAQRRRFLELAALFPDVPRSLANSAGAFRGADYGFDLTRPGIALYGGHAGPASDGRLRPVATLTATVLQVRTANAGEAAGYGAAAPLDRDTRIATIGIGYADGYPRAASGAGVPMRESRPGAMAFVAGRHVPVLGRVSMDLTLIDVTDLPPGAVTPGDSVELFGANVPVDAVAANAGTIAYELLTGLGPRVRRQWN